MESANTCAFVPATIVSFIRLTTIGYKSLSLSLGIAGRYTGGCRISLVGLLRLAPKLGVDATRKWPSEGFARSWPDEIVMDGETEKRVDALWPTLGLRARG